MINGERLRLLVFIDIKTPSSREMMLIFRPRWLVRRYWYCLYTLTNTFK